MELDAGRPCGLGTIARPQDARRRTLAIAIACKAASVPIAACHLVSMSVVAPNDNTSKSRTPKTRTAYGAMRRRSSPW
ncbi:hypothetical protein ACVWZL_009185 [Bradyrhizobium sp. GM2.4]